MYFVICLVVFFLSRIGFLKYSSSIMLLKHLICSYIVFVLSCAMLFVAIDFDDNILFEIHIEIKTEKKNTNLNFCSL